MSRTSSGEAKISIYKQIPLDTKMHSLWSMIPKGEPGSLTVRVLPVILHGSTFPYCGKLSGAPRLNGGRQATAGTLNRIGNREINRTRYDS
jgi:hypothetical protein